MKLVVGLLLAALCGCEERMVSSPSDPPPDFSAFIGRWVRPDGGYVLEVKGVDATGAATVAYFNPRPINVGRAVASQDVEGIALMVELQDMNYPGSTYHLKHDTSSQRMVGTYFQAASKETYDVYFERIQP